MIFVGIGSIAGSFIGINLSPDLLQRLIGIAIFFFLILLLLKPSMGMKRQKKGTVPKTIGYAVFVLTGIVSAIVGGGSAILFTFVLVFCFGETYLLSAGSRKPISILKHLIVILIYGAYGFIVWTAAIPLIIGNAIGSYLGSRFAIKHGEGCVRALFLVVTLIAAVKLFF
jgi:uncharacterized membrane protein YfcA